MAEYSTHAPMVSAWSAPLGLSLVLSDVATHLGKAIPYFSCPLQLCKTTLGFFHFFYNLNPQAYSIVEGIMAQRS